MKFGIADYGMNVWYILAVIGALNSVIALYYYARIIKAMFFLEETSPKNGLLKDQSSKISLYYSILLVIFVIPIIILGVYWIPLLNLVKTSLGIG